MARAKKHAPPQSPQAKLAAVIKTARDAMRKDAGLNGDLDRIPQLAWILFLRAFDALEQNREVTEANYRPAIEAPYRWRDWAADPNGRTGEALLEFVNRELLPYLRGRSGATEQDPRDVLAAVFRETNNRMLSGHLLRDVVDKVNEVNFASSDDIHTLAHLYESMLREMRDAAGDSGEFYTPRPVIRFMVQQVDPHLGEIVLDPACGTGGFLVEALEHMLPEVTTAQQRRELHSNLRGIEKKPLPFLLGMMNLVLHRVGQPNIVRGNALARPITQISKRDRVDVILTNPPFGGEEERTIQSNFPADKQTAETAWLFLQLVIRQLKDGGRCGMVVPNGLLFGAGVGARIKRQLLTECNLHTVVRLPDGVFEPYTPIPSNLLFFDKTGRTKEVWFYELPPPEGRKKYSKTRPMRFDEFEACQAWWAAREDNERAWRVSIADLEATEFDLDLHNPNRPDDLAHRPPAELITALLKTERDLIELLEDLRADAGVRATAVKNVRVGDVLSLERRQVAIDVSASYEEIGIRSFGKGIFHKEAVDGATLGAKRVFRIEPGDLVISNVFAWEGAIAVASEAERGRIGSHRFMTFVPRDGRIDTAWAAWYFRSESGLGLIRKASPGSAGRNKTLAVQRFEDLTIPLPPINEQRKVAQLLDHANAALGDLRRQGNAIAEAIVPALVNQEFAALR